MQLVHTRDVTPLLPIICNHVAPGTIVHSDQWRAYDHVANLSLVARHQTINHLVDFVDPTCGVFTQHVESYWNRVEVKLKHMRGCHLQQLPGYLDEYMWRERHGKTGMEEFASIMQNIIASKYTDFSVFLRKLSTIYGQNIGKYGRS